MAAQPMYAGYGTGLPPGWEYASYGSRVGAYLLDAAFSMLCVLPAVFILIPLTALASTGTGDPPGWLLAVWIPVMIVSYVVALWGTVWLTGTRGQSWGKKLVGIHVLRADGLVPIGGGMGIVRYLAIAVVSQLTCGIAGLLDVLWPLWDDRRQALHDKIVSSVVVRPTV
jgi:uncharacterized RDD family membrane protein YckC